MRVSYDTTELLEEAHLDLHIFGNVEVYAMVKDVQGFLLLTEYDHIVDDEPLTEEEKAEYRYIVKAKLKDVIKVLEIENNILTDYDLIKRALAKYLGIIVDARPDLN